MDGIPKIDSILRRHQELDAEMTDPAFFNDQRKAAASSREHQRLASIGELAIKPKASQDLSDNRDLLAEADTDEELKEMAQEEIAELEPYLLSKR